MPMPTGTGVLESLISAGVTHICTVPDWIQISLHHAAMAADPETIRLLQFCTEDEAITCAAGLIAGGGRPAVVVQNQGLYAGLNALRAVGLDASLPIVLLIGQFGREIATYTADPSESNRRVVRILGPVLDAVEVPYACVEDAADMEKVSDMFRQADAKSSPTAIIFGQNLILENAQ